MSKRKYEPGAFVPCSPKHKSCSPAHSALVAGYREERERQLVLFEAETGNYPGDIKLWKERGGWTPITFKTWLMSNKNQSMNTSEMKESKMSFSDSEVDKIFNEIVQNQNTCNSTEDNLESNEEECNCDCDMCCRNDHVACCNENDPCCLEAD